MNDSATREPVNDILGGGTLFRGKEAIQKSFTKPLVIAPPANQPTGFEQLVGRVFSGRRTRSYEEADQPLDSGIAARLPQPELLMLRPPATPPAASSRS